MKKLTIFLLLLAVSAITFSQETEKFDQEYYLKRSKSQKTAGYALVGASIGLVVVGGVVWSSGALEGFSNAFDNTGVNTNPDDGGPEMNTGQLLVMIGTAAAVCSIPLFIAASKNKQKAMKLSFKMQSVPQLQKTGLANSKIPSVNLKIGL